MAEDDDVLQKADALMRRRRVFVAGGANDPDGAVAAATAAADDEDIPLLTEVVEPEALERASGVVTVDVAALRIALAKEIESWLDKQLPGHVQRVLDGITDQLILQLAQKTRAELLPRLEALIAGSGTAAKPPTTAD